MNRTPHTAYFCMEYGLHESFPIYSGGLGVLAGDGIVLVVDGRGKQHRSFETIRMRDGPSGH